MKTVINVKADKEVKEQAIATAREMGLPLSTVVNGLLKKFILDKIMVFTAPFKPSKKLEKILRQADKDIEAGRNLSPVFHTVDELMADLQS